MWNFVFFARRQITGAYLFVCFFLFFFSFFFSQIKFFFFKIRCDHPCRLSSNHRFLRSLSSFGIRCDVYCGMSSSRISCCVSFSCVITSDIFHALCFSCLDSFKIHSKRFDVIIPAAYLLTIDFFVHYLHLGFVVMFIVACLLAAYLAVFHFHALLPQTFSMPFALAVLIHSKSFVVSYDAI